MTRVTGSQASSQENYSLRRDFVDAFFQRQAPLLADGSRVLDLGGHKWKKRGRFDLNRYPLRIFYANLTTDKGTDIRCDAARLSFAAASFEAVICAEVLEHLPRPEQVIREAQRVLCPGGTLLVTVPFLYRIHADPEDYGRYTAYYWSLQLQDAGFSPVSVEAQGSFYAVLIDMYRQYINTRWRPPWIGLGRWILRGCQRRALRKETQPAVQADSFLQSFTTGYGIVARKKIDGGNHLE